jgi:hypothetical protein
MDTISVQNSSSGQIADIPALLSLPVDWSDVVARPFTSNSKFKEMALQMLNTQYFPGLRREDFMTVTYIISRYDKIFAATRQQQFALVGEYITEAKNASRSLSLELLPLVHAYSLPVLAHHATAKTQYDTALELLNEALEADEYVEKEYGNPAWHIHKIHVLHNINRVQYKKDDDARHTATAFNILLYLQHQQDNPGASGNWGRHQYAAIPGSYNLVMQVQILHDILGRFIRTAAAGNKEEIITMATHYFPQLSQYNLPPEENLPDNMPRINDTLNKWISTMQQWCAGHHNPFIAYCTEARALPGFLNRFKLFYFWQLVNLAEAQYPELKTEIARASRSFLQTTTDIDDSSLAILTTD